MAEVRGPSHARLHARRRIEGPGKARRQDRGARVQGEGRSRRLCALPRGRGHAGGMLPEGRGRLGGCGGRCPRMPRPPRIALEKARDQQRPGEDQQGDKAQVQGRAGLPVREVAGEARGGPSWTSRTRSGRDRAASRSGRWQSPAIPAHPWSRPPWRSRRWRTRRQGRRWRQASSLQTGWRQPKIASQIPGSGCPPARPGTRPGAHSRIHYTSIPDTTSASGSYGHTRRQMINRPQLFWDYWEKRTATSMLV